MDAPADILHIARSAFERDNEDDRWRLFTSLMLERIEELIETDFYPDDIWDDATDALLQLAPRELGVPMADLAQAVRDITEDEAFGFAEHVERVAELYEDQRRTPTRPVASTARDKTLRDAEDFVMRFVPRFTCDSSNPRVRLARALVGTALLSDIGVDFAARIWKGLPAGVPAAIGAGVDLGFDYGMDSSEEHYGRSYSAPPWRLVMHGGGRIDMRRTLSIIERRASEFESHLDLRSSMFWLKTLTPPRSLWEGQA
jgi:hypothetical protein